MVMIPDSAFVCRTKQEESVDETNGYVTMIPHYLLARAVNTPLLDAILQEHEHNPIVLEAIQALWGNGPSPARTSLEDWQMGGAIIWYQECVYVPMNKEL